MSGAATEETIVEHPRTAYGRKPWKLDGPVQVGARQFTIRDLPGTPRDFPGQGNELWPCSIVLAALLDDLEDDELGNSLLDAGCGLGLVGISVADRCRVTLAECDRAVGQAAERNLIANFREARMCFSHFQMINEHFDSIVGSELIYGAFSLPSLAQMISRCWTGRGICLFVASWDADEQQWQNALKVYGLSAEKSAFEHTLPNGQYVSCLLWKVSR